MKKGWHTPQSFLLPSGCKHKHVSTMTSPATATRLTRVIDLGQLSPGFCDMWGFHNRHAGSRVTPLMRRDASGVNIGVPAHGDWPSEVQRGHATAQPGASVTPCKARAAAMTVCMVQQ